MRSGNVLPDGSNVEDILVRGDPDYGGDIAHDELELLVPGKSGEKDLTSLEEGVCRLFGRLDLDPIYIEISGPGSRSTAVRSVRQPSTTSTQPL